MKTHKTFASANHSDLEKRLIFGETLDPTPPPTELEDAEAEVARTHEELQKLRDGVNPDEAFDARIRKINEERDAQVAELRAYLDPTALEELIKSEEIQTQARIEVMEELANIPEFVRYNILRESDGAHKETIYTDLSQDPLEGVPEEIQEDAREFQRVVMILCHKLGVFVHKDSETLGERIKAAVNERIRQKAEELTSQEIHSDILRVTEIAEEKIHDLRDALNKARLAWIEARERVEQLETAALIENIQEVRDEIHDDDEDADGYIDKKKELGEAEEAWKAEEARIRSSLDARFTTQFASEAEKRGETEFEKLWEQALGADLFAKCPNIAAYNTMSHNTNLAEDATTIEEYRQAAETDVLAAIRLKLAEAFLPTNYEHGFHDEYETFGERVRKAFEEKRKEVIQAVVSRVESDRETYVEEMLNSEMHSNSVYQNYSAKKQEVDDLEAARAERRERLSDLEDANLDRSKGEYEQAKADLKTAEENLSRAEEAYKKKEEEVYEKRDEKIKELQSRKHRKELIEQLSSQPNGEAYQAVLKELPEYEDFKKMESDLGALGYRTEQDYLRNKENSPAVKLLNPLMKMLGVKYYSDYQKITEKLEKAFQNRVEERAEMLAREKIDAEIRRVETEAEEKLARSYEGVNLELSRNEYNEAEAELNRELDEYRDILDPRVGTAKNDFEQVRAQYDTGLEAWEEAQDAWKKAEREWERSTTSRIETTLPMGQAREELCKNAPFCDYAFLMSEGVTSKDLAKKIKEDYYKGDTKITQLLPAIAQALGVNYDENDLQHIAEDIAEAFEERVRITAYGIAQRDGTLNQEVILASQTEREAYSAARKAYEEAQSRFLNLEGDFKAKREAYRTLLNDQLEVETDEHEMARAKLQKAKDRYNEAWFRNERAGEDFQWRHKEIKKWAKEEIKKIQSSEYMVYLIGQYREQARQKVSDQAAELTQQAFNDLVADTAKKLAEESLDGRIKAINDQALEDINRAQKTILGYETPQEEIHARNPLQQEIDDAKEEKKKAKEKEKKEEQDVEAVRDRLEELDD